MKKYIISAVCILVSLTGCDQSRLDIPQKGVVPMEEFYITDDDAVAALASGYQKAMCNISRFSVSIYSPFMCLFNWGGDDMYHAGTYYGGSNDFLAAINEYRYTDDNEVIKNCYKGLYQAVYGMNLVIDNFEYGVSEVKDRCISEARVIRAFAHMMLAIGWDNPPLIDHLIEGSDRPGNTPHDEVLTWVAEECEDAAKYLYERRDIHDKDRAGEVTKGFAWAVAGKARLFLGDYAGAKADLKKVIDSGKYALVPGERMTELFHIEGDGNEEKVFEFNHIYNANNVYSDRLGRSTWMFAHLLNWRNDQLAGYPVLLFGTGWGYCAPTGKFARGLIENDGIDSWRRKAWIKTFDEVLYEMEYPTDSKCPTLEDKMKDPYRGISKIDGLYSNEGYFDFKRVSYKSDMINNTYGDYNFQLMRYAEVLLMYAECCAVTSDSDGSGLKALNDVQKRAGSKTISSKLTLDAVKTEKLYEMWLEGCRWPDLVRWGEASTVLATNGDKMPNLRDLYFSSNASEKTDVHTPYVDWSKANYNANIEHGFRAGKHEHFPYPFSETSINPNIVQNPGW